MLGLAAAVAVLGCSTAVAVHHDQARPSGSLPNHQLTPGRWETSLTAEYLCNHSTDERRNVTAATKRKVFAEYRITYPAPAQRDQYEVDHLVPLTLGGTNDVANLWPEQAPGFHDKDRLELKLHELVCAKTHPLDLRTAQTAIATDWRKAYETYVGSTKSLAPADGTAP